MNFYHIIAYFVNLEGESSEKLLYALLITQISKEDDTPADRQGFF
jgi:hypothetical protein